MAVYVVRHGVVAAGGRGARGQRVVPRDVRRHAGHAAALRRAAAPPREAGQAG